MNKYLISYYYENHKKTGFARALVRTDENYFKNIEKLEELIENNGSKYKVICMNIILLEKNNIIKRFLGKFIRHKQLKNEFKVAIDKEFDLSRWLDVYSKRILFIAWQSTKPSS